MSDLRIAEGHVVSVVYSIRDVSGVVLEQRDVPIEYLQGANSGLFPEIEEALEGCVAGESVEVTLPPERAFGPHVPGLEFTDDIENSPPELRYVGAEFEMQNERGEGRMLRVSRIEGNRITVDANHPMAGKTVTFTVQVLSVRPATREELAGGGPEDAGSRLQ